MATPGSSPAYGWVILILYCMYLVKYALITCVAHMHFSKHALIQPAVLSDATIFHRITFPLKHLIH